MCMANLHASSKSWWTRIPIGLLTLTLYICAILTCTMFPCAAKLQKDKKTRCTDIAGRTGTRRLITWTGFRTMLITGNVRRIVIISNSSNLQNWFIGWSLYIGFIWWGMWKRVKMRKPKTPLLIFVSLYRPNFTRVVQWKKRDAANGIHLNAYFTAIENFLVTCLAGKPLELTNQPISPPVIFSMQTALPWLADRISAFLLFMFLFTRWTGLHHFVYIYFLEPYFIYILLSFPICLKLLSIKDKSPRGPFEIPCKFLSQYRIRGIFLPK